MSNTYNTPGGGRPQPGQDGFSTMKEDASALKRDVAAEARDTSAELRNTASDVAGNVQEKGAEVVDAVKAKAEDLADQGKAFGAEKAEGFAGAVRRVADDLEGTSPEIARHVRVAADSIEGVAGSLRERSIGSLIEDVNGFARRQPAAFFGAAVLAGFAISRFAKSSAAGAMASATTHSGTPAGLSGHAPGWAPPRPGAEARPLTMPAASLGGAAAHRPGTAGPGSMPTNTEASS